MSNTLAIATVSAVLQNRITTLLDLHMSSDFDATAGPPRSPLTPGVYVHLYRVTPNATLRNADLPTRSASGTLARRPRLALDLHYALTFVGITDNTTFDAERLAGLVLTDLHARPMLHPDEIDAYVRTRAADHVLAEADLADQLARVRFTVQALDLEDESRLWAMYGRDTHFLTVALLGSTVLLDDQVSPTTAPPATQGHVRVIAGTSPQLLAALSSARPQPVVQFRDVADPDDLERLVLRGSGLSGEHLRVQVGPHTVSAFESVTADEIRFRLDPASGLTAGIHTAAVVHLVDVDPGAAEDLRPAARSNNVVVSLVPEIAASGAATATATGHHVLLDITPLPGVDQDLELLLDHGTHGQVRSTDWEIVGTQVRFHVLGLSTGPWLMRLTIDGASTLLQGGFGTPFSGPSVTVP